MVNIGRKFAALAAISGAIAGSVVLPVAPASSAEVVHHFGGNFFDDDRVEIFEYRPSGLDRVFQFSNDGSGPVFTSVTQAIGGNYAPIPLNLDGDAYDEIFWFAPGATADVIWDFNGTHAPTATPAAVSGLYFPTAGDYTGDGTDDILWYAPGPAADTLWEFDSDGTHTASPVPLSGDYVPVPGVYTDDGTDDVMLYGRGDIPDHVLDFHPGATASYTTILSFDTISGDNHQPFPLDSRNDGWTDVFFNNAFTTSDAYWNGTAELTFTKTTENRPGTFEATAGDLFADDHDDVFWFNDTSSSIWDWHDSPAGLVLDKYDFGTTSLSTLADEAEANGNHGRPIPLPAAKETLAFSS